ncbi:hypothetical protein DZS_49930 [Dickeya ananatis]
MAWSLLVSDWGESMSEMLEFTPHELNVMSEIIWKLASEKKLFQFKKFTVASSYQFAWCGLRCFLCLEFG